MESPEFLYPYLPQDTCHDLDSGMLDLHDFLDDAAPNHATAVIDVEESPCKRAEPSQPMAGVSEPRSTCIRRGEQV